jgi:alkylhydroperoxidase family enzyme
VLSGDGYLASPLFDEREKAVIRWAELVAYNQAKYDDEAFAELRRYFDDAGVVELTIVAAFRSFMNRFMDSLQIELEPPEVQARGGVARASTDVLRSYVEDIVKLM